VTRARWWAAVVLVLVAGASMLGWGKAAIARGLVCLPEEARDPAILVENLDPSYLLFERAAALQRDRPSTRVLVPAQAASGYPEVANPVSQGVAQLMGRLAGVRNLEIIPIREAEPYSLTTARQVRDFLTREHLPSISLVATGFRSRRSSLVYRTVLGSVGVQVHCVPVFGQRTPENWTDSWHGIEVVVEQFLKLQFYRFYVLPQE
jgi:hypothetical protein